MNEKWISINDQMPEPGAHVLVSCCTMGIYRMRSYVCVAFHTGHFTTTCSYNDDIDMEYSEADDEYYMPEGWWEVIKNWDDYTCVAIQDNVTHWMLLPEPVEEAKA